MKNLSQFSDSELYSICKKWGREALAARRRFAGLLPEVYRREMESRVGGGGIAESTQPSPADGTLSQLNLSFSQNSPRKSWLERRGYTCIYEFTARLAGMSRDQVNRVLQLDKRFSALPILHESLINGDVSVNKLARIASVATLENQRELLNKAKKLSKAALEIYIKEYRIKCGMDLRGAVEAEVVAGKGDTCNGTQFMTDDNRQKMKMVSMVVGRAGESTLPDEQSAGMNMARAGMSAVTDEQNTGMNMGSASQGMGQTVVSLFESDVLNKPSLDVLTAEAGSSTTAKAGAVPGHRFGDTETKTHGLQLDTDVEIELKELQAKGIDVSEFLRKCLEQRRLEIEREKEKLAEEANRDREDKFLIGKPASRHIPARIRKIVVKEHGKKCSVPTCGKPAAHIHHEKRFTSFGSHDPRYLRPLCKAHHELAHEGDAVYARFRGGG